MRQALIYISICRSTGKAYVGQTVQFEIRKRQHLRDAFLEGRGCPKFYAAIRKHGNDNFIWCRIFCEEQRLNEMETHWIERLNSIQDGYNVTRGGVGIAGAFAGRKHSPQAKAKQTIASAGHRHSPETRLKMGLWKRTGERNHKISLALKGKIFSRTHRANLSKSRIGNKYCLGRVLSPETKLKISESQKLRLTRKAENAFS